MGLDSVELVMAVEETFDIQIDDDDFPELRTVGDLHDLIVARVAHPPNDRMCLSPGVFCKFRSALMNTLDIVRSNIRLGTSMASLIPKAHRTASWNRLQESLGLTLPQLHRPEWIVGTLAFSALLASTLLGLYTTVVLEKSVSLAIILSGGLATLLGFAFTAISRPLAIQFPSSCSTVRGTTSAIMRANLSRLTNEGELASESEIFEVLQSIISCHLEVSLEDVTRDANLIDDLGMN